MASTSTLHAYGKVEQLFPEFNMLYRGPTRLGILLYVKGIKVYYYDFVKNKRYAIFEKYLFQNQDARLGKFRIENFSELVGLMKNQSLSSPTFSPCRSICSSSSTSLNSLRSIYSDIEAHSHNNLIQYATEKIRLELQDAVECITKNVQQAVAKVDRTKSDFEDEMRMKITILEEQIEKISTLRTSDTDSTNSQDARVGKVAQQQGFDERCFKAKDCSQDAGAKRKPLNEPGPSRTDRHRINQYFNEGKAYTGIPLRTRGRKGQTNGMQVRPKKPKALQPYRGRSAILTNDERIPFAEYYLGESGPDILDAELRYIATKPEARKFIEKIEPYVTGSPCPAEVMDNAQFISELFDLLIESQLLRPF